MMFVGVSVFVIVWLYLNWEEVLDFLFLVSEDEYDDEEDEEDEEDLIQGGDGT